MKINIFGSTGIIGTKSLHLIDKYFSKISVNLLTANKNYKKLLYQSKKFKPKYVFINDDSKYSFLKKNLPKKTYIFNKKELNDYLTSTKIDMTILSISGYESLNYLEPILINTKNLGLVNKECIVSGGHLFKKLIKKYKVNIFPLDSEHFSLKSFFDFKSKYLHKYNKIYLTASGGPFFYSKLTNIKNVSFEKAVKHPKWDMGYKNSIDSATLANKCLELIEAHYLFNIPFDKLKIIIHPQSLVHSIIEMENFTSELNYFYHDMNIPIFNFLNINRINKTKIPKLHNKYKFFSNSNLEFYDVDEIKFPIIKIFNKIKKDQPINLIKFNLSNEYAVNLFKEKKIKYGDIHNIIQESMSINLKMPVNNFKNIINYHRFFYNKLKSKYEKN